MLLQLSLLAIVIQTASIVCVFGHGNIIVPKPSGNSEHPYYIGGPAGTINMAELVEGSSYGDYPKAADAWFSKNNIASLKDYITQYGTGISECGNTAKNGAAQPVPSDGFAQHDTLGNSHPGPCEIWCDSTRVYNDADCAKTLKGASPTKIPIDVSTCKSSSEFVFYWLALHAQPWQVYINCVALDGSAAASSRSANSTSTTSQTSGASTTTETQSTEASVEGEASEAAKSTTSTTSTTKTSDTTATPTVTTSKCTGRRSRS